MKLRNFFSWRFIENSHIELLARFFQVSNEIKNSQQVLLFSSAGLNGSFNCCVAIEISQLTAKKRLNYRMGDHLLKVISRSQMEVKRERRRNSENGWSHGIELLSPVSLVS